MQKQSEQCAFCFKCHKYNKKNLKSFSKFYLHTIFILGQYADFRLLQTIQQNQGPYRKFIAQTSLLSGSQFHNKFGTIYKIFKQLQKLCLQISMIYLIYVQIGLSQFPKQALQDAMIHDRLIKYNDIFGRQIEEISQIILSFGDWDSFEKMLMRVMRVQECYSFKTKIQILQKLLKLKKLIILNNVISPRGSRIRIQQSQICGLINFSHLNTNSKIAKLIQILQLGIECNLQQVLKFLKKKQKKTNTSQINKVIRRNLVYFFKCFFRNRNKMMKSVNCQSTQHQPFRQEQRSKQKQQQPQEQEQKQEEQQSKSDKMQEQMSNYEVLKKTQKQIQINEQNIAVGSLVCKLNFMAVKVHEGFVYGNLLNKAIYFQENCQQYSAQASQEIDVIALFRQVYKISNESTDLEFHSILDIGYKETKANTQLSKTDQEATFENNSKLAAFYCFVFCLDPQLFSGFINFIEYFVGTYIDNMLECVEIINKNSKKKQQNDISEFKKDWIQKLTKIKYCTQHLTNKSCIYISAFLQKLNESPKKIKNNDQIQKQISQVQIFFCKSKTTNAGISTNMNTINARRSESGDMSMMENQQK